MREGGVEGRAAHIGFVADSQAEVDAAYAAALVAGATDSGQPAARVRLQALAERTMKTLMIYGAAGYTGRMATGLDVIVAGRAEDPVQRVAAEPGLPWRTFPVDDPTAIATAPTTFGGQATWG